MVAISRGPFKAKNKEVEGEKTFRLSKKYNQLNCQ